jgi:heme exporter protein A
VGGRDGLSVTDLAAERGGRLVLSGLTFAVAPGTALAVTGENGAGKSTLLRALAGLLPLAHGQVTLRVREAAVAPGEQAHYLGHTNGLKVGLTAAENLRFRQRWGGGSGSTPADALTRVGLAQRAAIPTGMLSAGQKRRVALAGLLVAQRPLWLLDEPATALDRDAEALLVGLIGDHLAAGGLAVMALHAPLRLPMRMLRLEPNLNATPSAAA